MAFARNVEVLLVSFWVFSGSCIPISIQNFHYSRCSQAKERFMTKVPKWCKGNGNIFFIFSLERTFKTICKTLLPLFHILLTSTNILIERNKMSAIFNFCRYACTSQQGSSNIFIQTTTDYFAFKTILCLPFEISRSLKTFKTSTNQYLVSNEYFYMVNSCCDVTKTTVNEIKKLSKMADISLLQVKIFQELSKI